LKTNQVVVLAVACSLVLVLGIVGTCFAVLPSDTATGIYDAVFSSNIINAFPELNLSTEVIQELRSKGIGWGEITLAASLASSSGKTLDEVIAMADSELGWGKIVEELGVDPKTLGHGVGEVIESAKDGRVDKDALENAAISDLLASNFGLENSEVAALAESGLKKQDVLMALSAAAVAGNAGTFEKALALRQESRNWQDVFEALGIDPRGVRDMRTVMQRSEIKDQLREMVKGLRKGQEKNQEGTDTELNSETAEGSGDQTLDEDSNTDNAQNQENVKDDQNNDDKDDQDKGDTDDQNKGDKDDQKLEKKHMSDDDSVRNKMGAGQGKSEGNNDKKRGKRNNERARDKNGEEDED